MNTIKQKIVLASLVIILQACGTVHIQSNVITEDLSNYTSAYISEVDIQSREQNSDSIEMNKKMKAYAEEQLKELITKNKYNFMKFPFKNNSFSLAFKLNLDIIYGSRAARYWGGFGAGKGTVKSVFEVVDSKSGKIKYSATGASDLSMGAFGGSMESVIKQNIDKLISSYNPNTQ